MALSVLAGQRRGAGSLGRGGPDQRGDRPGARGLLDLDLAADAVHPQVSHDGLDRLGLGVQPDLPGAQPQDPHVGLHVALAVEQGRVTALVRSHGVEVVGELALKELGGVGALDERRPPRRRPRKPASSRRARYWPSSSIVERLPSPPIVGTAAAAWRTVSFGMSKFALWRIEKRREALQPPPAAGRRGGGARRRWPSCTRPFRTRGCTGRSAAARRRPPGRRRCACRARRPRRRRGARELRRRQGRSPRQRLQPHRDPARLRPRQDAAAGERPGPARVRAGRGRQGDRGRAGGQVRRLDLQRPRPRPDPALPRGRAAADQVRQRLRPPAHGPLPRDPSGRHGRRAGGRREQRRGPDRARQELHLRVRRRSVRAAPLPLPRDAARVPHLQGAVRGVRHRSAARPPRGRRAGDGDERLRHQLRRARTRSTR